MYMYMYCVQYNADDASLTLVCVCTLKLSTQRATGQCQSQVALARLQHSDVRLEEVRLHARAQETHREETRVYHYTDTSVHRVFVCDVISRFQGLQQYDFCSQLLLIRCVYGYT